MSRIISVLILIVISLSTLTSCIHLDVLKVRNQAEQLYKEGRTNEIIPLVESAMAKVEKELGPDHYYIGEAHSALAVLYAYTINDFVIAEDYFKRALEIRTKTRGPEHPDTIETINLMGFLYQVTGRLDLAEANYKKALELRSKVLGPNHPDTVDSEVYLAGLYLLRGRYAEAEKLALHASKYEQKKVSARHPTPGEALFMLGTINSVMGNLEQSEKYYLESLDLKLKELGENHTEVSHSMMALGNVYRNQGDYDQAIEYYSKALEYREQSFGRTHGFTGDTLIALGTTYLRKNQKDIANQYLFEGLEIYKQTMGEENHRVLIAELNLAYMYLSQNDFMTAGQLAENILASPHTQILPSLSWQSQLAYSISNYQLGNRNAAILFGKNAINELQRTRSEITSLDANLQQGFVRDRAYAYRILAAMLIETGRLAEAQLVLTMLKEEEHFSYVRRSNKFDDIKSTQVEYNPVENEWQQRYQQIKDQLALKGQQMQQLRLKKKKGLTAEEEADLELIREDLKIAKKAFKGFLDELALAMQNVSQGRAAEIGEKNLSSLKAMQGTLRELGDGVVLVNYLVTDETLYIILTTSNVQIVRRNQIKSAELNLQIHQLRQALQNPVSDIKPLAQNMYQLLIEPIAKDLEQAGAVVVMSSLDGALRYVPMASLHDGEQYMAEKYSFAIYTAAAQTKLTTKPQADWSIAGLGLAKQAEGFSPLPAVHDELNKLVNTGPEDDDGVLPGIIHLDEEFTKDVVVDVLDVGYPVLHIASHFVFKPGTESNSFLLLGDGSRLSLAEISEEDYDFNGVDMLSLSACETAVGGLGADGKEIEGFGWLAQRQGAKSVLATLWPVADASTGEFMQNLYQSRQQQNLSKAQALRQTQLDFINNSIDIDTDSSGRGIKLAGATESQPELKDINNTYQHPYYWAPFILMGNWL